MEKCQFGEQRRWDPEKYSACGDDEVQFVVFRDRERPQDALTTVWLCKSHTGWFMEECRKRAPATEFLYWGPTRPHKILIKDWRDGETLFHAGSSVDRREGFLSFNLVAGAEDTAKHAVFNSRFEAEYEIRVLQLQNAYVVPA